MSLFVIDKIERLARAGLNVEQIQHQLEIPYSIQEIEQYVPFALRTQTRQRRKAGKVNLAKTAKYARQQGFQKVIVI